MCHHCTLEVSIKAGLLKLEVVVAGVNSEGQQLLQFIGGREFHLLCQCELVGKEREREVMAVMVSIFTCSKV